MTIYFTHKLREPLSKIDFSDIADPPKCKETDKGIEFSFNDRDLLDIKLCINSTISLIGIDDGGTGFTNEIGDLLYELYDELMYQTN